MKHLGLLKILLLKNILLRRRTLCLTIMEALVPFFYTFVFCIVRYYTKNDLRILPEHMEEVPIPRPFQATKATVIGYAPKCSASTRLMSDLETLLLSKPWFNIATPVKVVGFKSEYSMIHFAEKHPDFLYYAYAFDNMTNETKTLPANLSVILRLPTDKALQGHKDVFLYEAKLLHILMEAFINTCTKRQNNISVELEEFNNTMVARRDSFLLKDMYRVSLIIVGLTAYLVWRNVYLIASERESSILMLIQQMGVNPIIYWLSWLITTLICNTLVCLFFAGPLFFSIFHREPVLKASDSSLVVTYFIAVGFALSSYCVLGSVMFDRAETCSAVASIIYVLVTFPAIETQKRSDETYIASVMFTSVNILLAFSHIGRMEHQGVGYRWEMKASIRNTEHFTVSLFCSGVVYLILAWLVYNIKIHRRAPWSAFKDTQTCFKNFSYIATTRDGKTYSKIAVRVEKLCVNAARKLTDITMIMLEDTITVLTGKELSGKGIFMSVLKGETKPSSGTVKIYGLDIVNDSMAVKLITGTCPREQTAIFPELTVLENLQFFATIKHLCQEKEMTNTLSLAQEFELESILSERVADLCVSDKRLLQVTVAFVGDNKVVLLEDPSVNMDIRTKFSLWSIVRDKAYNRTIILNTNFMDEVEMSGDRIAVFREGELKCCGTMQYINLYLGAGYHLIIEKGDNCKVRRIEYIVYNLVVESGLLEDSENQMIFWLPMKTTESFSSLFTLLSTHRNKLGISRFIVNATTIHDAIINLSSVSSSHKVYIRIPEVDRKLVPSPSDASVCNVRVRDKLHNMLLTDTYNVLAPESRKLSKSQRSKVDMLDSLMGSFSTDSFLIHAILTSMAKSRYSGNALLWSQTVALLKKKLLYSTSLLHVELFQVAILILLSYWIAAPLGEHYCNMNECAQSTKFNTTLRAAVTVSEGDNPNNVTQILVKKYRNLFNYSHVEVLEFNKTNPEMSFDMFVKSINKRSVIGVIFNVSNELDRLKATAYYEPRDVDLGPTVLRSLSAVMNTFLQYLTNSDRYGIHPSTQPRIINAVVVTHVSGNMADMQANRFSHHASVLNAVALLMVAYYPVMERLTGSKDLQMLSGTSPILYWFTTFIFDYFTYIFLCNTYSMSSAKVSNDEATDLMYSLMSLYMLNGLMMIIYVYAMQSFFSSPSTAVGFMMIFNYCLGNPSSTFLNFADEEGTVSIKDTLMVLFFLTPPHILPQSVYHLILRSRAKEFCKNFIQFCKDPENVNYRSDCCKDDCDLRGHDKCIDSRKGGQSRYLQELSVQLWAMLLHTLFWMAILILVEYKIFSKCKEKLCKKHFKKGADNRKAFYTTPSMSYSKRRQSVSYAKLRHRSSSIIQNLPTDSSVTDFSQTVGGRAIVFMDVMKKVNDDVIVSDITFKIEEGNIFCLAGSDIEAPSLLVEMICGLQKPTRGQIIVHGKQVKSVGRPDVAVSPYIVWLFVCHHDLPCLARPKSVYPIGYCSNKTSGLMPMLTGQETLLLFARLRGVAEFNLKRLVEIYMNAFHLDTIANKHTASYSDCERRRLSIAAALIGEPKICLLCDPMYKLDTESREAVWRWLKKLKHMYKTIVIATDQLQEMGKHAAYIMILVDGSPVCVGTANDIETMCCKGYTLFAKIDPKNASDAISLFYSMLREKFPYCQLFHCNQDLLHFHIPYEDDRLADIFATLEAIKKVVKVESYRVSKTNLDQVQIATQNAYFVQRAGSGLMGEGDDYSLD